MNWNQIFSIYGVLTLGLGIGGGSVLASAADPFTVKTVWSASAAPLPLKSWNLSELAKLRTLSSQEKDLVSGKVDQWKGVLISQFVEKALADLPLDHRAQVDLLIFKNAQGVQSVIPRNLVKNYPLLLAFEKNHQPLGANELSVVVPITSSPRISNEGLPLAAFQLSGVTQIDFSSYRAQFDSLFLKRRTDPAAIRGEKTYVQNCISCHGAGRAPSIAEISHGASSRSLASVGHPTKVPGFPLPNSREMRGLSSYLEAYRAEHATQPTQQAQQAQ